MHRSMHQKQQKMKPIFCRSENSRHEFLCFLYRNSTSRSLAWSDSNTYLDVEHIRIYIYFSASLSREWEIFLWDLSELCISSSATLAAAAIHIYFVSIFYAMNGNSSKCISTLFLQIFSLDFSFYSSSARAIKLVSGRCLSQLIRKLLRWRPRRLWRKKLQKNLKI